MAHDPGGTAAPPPRDWRTANNGEHGPGPEIPRGAPKGERPVAGNARRLTQGRVVARSAQIDRTPGPPVVRKERKAGSPGLRIERGVCASVMTRRDGCLACIRAPPALRPPLVGANWNEAKWREERKK